MNNQTTKSQFETFYDKFCEINNCLYSVYSIDFQTGISPDSLKNSNNNVLIYTNSKISPNSKQDVLVVYKNQSGIFLCFEQIYMGTIDLKLIFDSNKVSSKDLELFIITLKKENKKYESTNITRT
jgi:hypothetical protein